MGIDKNRLSLAEANKIASMVALFPFSVSNRSAVKPLLETVILIYSELSSKKTNCEGQFSYFGE